MNGISLNFPSNGDNYINTNCFIGINGSGKSQLLETIAEIFLYLDNSCRSINPVKKLTSPALFEIEYSLNIKENDVKVNVLYDNYKNKLPKFKITENGNDKLVDSDDLNTYLPSKIIGYTSGSNETISNPFLSYYDVYADFVATRAFGGSKEEDYEPRFYFMDYNTNLGIAISNLVFDIDKKNTDANNPLTKVKKELNIEKIKSFQIVIQTMQPAAPKLVSDSGETGVILTTELKKWLNELKKSSTCYDYSVKYNRYTFDFLLDSASKEALAYFFKTPYNLYSALYKFEILNNLIIDKATRKSIESQRAQRKLTAKMPEVPDKDKVLKYSELKLRLTNGQTVDYLSLSDGEHQFFNVLGTLLMIKDENALFLLDEPETHFNPKWRRLFISKINSITQGRKQDLFITSHSPFIISDTSKEFVYIFKRKSKDEIEVEFPKLETFGASFNHVLKMAFDLDDSMSEDSAQFIEMLLKSEDPKEIEEGINKLGDSPKIMTLYRRLDMLENK
ncbi:restriction system-associated AAA family ATPase [Flavobacterium sp. J27]|uniref:restriction system-associated AAA family ATPase n=1 Tax=Flavobacterium sp. J27 TaxID=2060419 RepID=UPI001F0E3842|nr:restriction system-associated AAA family ATPase [Flavobacterium sp. J27]